MPLVDLGFWYNAKAENSVEFSAFVDLGFWHNAIFHTSLCALQIFFTVSINVTPYLRLSPMKYSLFMTDGLFISTN